MSCNLPHPSIAQKGDQNGSPFRKFLNNFSRQQKYRERTHNAFTPGGRFGIIDTCNLCLAELTSPTLQEVMNMEKFLETLKRHIAEHPPNFGDGESVLTMLYECHNEDNPHDNKQIKEVASINNIE